MNNVYTLLTQTDKDDLKNYFLLKKICNNLPEHCMKIMVINYNHPKLNKSSNIHLINYTNIVLNLCLSELN